MRKIIPALVAIATLAVPATSLANASNHVVSGYGGGAGVTETGWIGSQQGNVSNTTQQYSSTYTDPVIGGPLTCNGVHQVKKSGVQDSFTCTLVKGTGVASLNQGIYAGWQTGWNSDFYGVAAENGTPIAGATQNGTMVVQSVSKDANGNILSYTGLATYPGATA